MRALATLNQQKPTGSPELGRSPFWDRPSRALPDPEEMPASDPSRPPVGPTVNDAPASHLLVPYIISRQARGERKASAGSQAGRSGALTRPAAEPAQAFFLALGLPQGLAPHGTREGQATAS